MVVEISAWKDIYQFQCTHVEAQDYTQMIYSVTIRRRVQQWMVVESSIWKFAERYNDGEMLQMNFTLLTYSMTIRRRVGFYVYALIIPSVLLSFLMPLMFWLPTSGDGRITLGVY